MILRFEERLFEQSDPAATLSLLKLFRSLEGREDAVLPWPKDREVGPGSPIAAWIAALPDQHDRKQIQNLFEWGPTIEQSIPERPSASHQPGRWRRAGPLDVRVILAARSDWRSLHLTPGDAVDLLAEPVHLFFENDRNDRAFLRFLFPATHRRDFELLYNSAGRVHAHGNGTGYLQTHFGELAQAPVLNPVEFRRLWRTWVLFDRDAATDNALSPSDTITKLIATLEQVHATHGVPVTWICLQRREIESYIPDSGLRACRPVNSYPFVKTLVQWRRSDPQQAWAFDLKKGLLGDLAPGVTNERRRDLKRINGPDLLQHDLKRPWDRLSGADRRKLRRGLGDSWFLERLTQKAQPAIWLEDIAAEYERGPAEQIPRAALIQSVFDRV